MKRIITIVSCILLFSCKPTYECTSIPHECCKPTHECISPTIVIIKPRQPMLYSGMTMFDFRYKIDSALIDQQLQLDSLKALIKQ